METQTLTQTITILVGEDGLATTGISLLPLLAISVTLIASGVLAWHLTFRRSHRHKLSFRSLSIFAFLALAAVGLTLNLSGASAAPTLTLGANQNNLTVTVPEGGGTASTTTTLTSGTTNPDGYTLTTALTEPEPGIDIKLKGGDVATSTPLEPGATPLTLKTTDSTTSGDTTEVTLDFTIDGTVTSGTKELKLVYAATDNESTTPPAPTTMQGMTADYCENNMTIYDGTNEDAILELTDSRGDTPQTYQVAKLADGNCWMLGNLKLGSTTGTTVLTPTDTDIAANFTLPQVATTGTADYDNPGAYGPVPGDTGEGATNYGYLYNWSAATAGESRTSHPEDAGDAPYSICPANWRLPTGGGSGEFAALYTALDSSVGNWNYPGAFKGAFAGNWWEGFYGQGVYGNAWSASAYPGDSDIAFLANFNSDGVNPANNDDRVAGLPVRCLLN